MCTGKADYSPIQRDEMGERLHIIGDGKRPIMLCKKKDVYKLFTPEFWQYFEVWEYYHYGFGLPGGLTWDKQNPKLMKVLLEIEKHFQHEFSTGATSIKYMESIIRHQRAAMGIKN